MEKNKRVIACAAVFLLLMGIGWYSFQNNLQLESGNSGERLEEEAGKKKEVFLITSKEDWITFCSRVNRGGEELTGVLQQDIDLEGEFHWILHYQGHFDGQGHAVSNTRRALFEILGEEAVVENLVVKEVDIRQEEEDRNVGAIADSNAGLIKNCQVYGYLEGNYFVGGMTGFNTGDIENCTNYASIVSLAEGEGESLWKEYTYNLYGAGGIAGCCYNRRMGDERGKRKSRLGKSVFSDTGGKSPGWTQGTLDTSAHP